MRLHQDQHSIRQQDLPYPLEGMDHALECDSSKRPAEQCNIEWLAASAKPFCRSHAKRNVVDAFRGRHPTSDGDSRWIGFDGEYAGRQMRVLAGEPAVAASDLQDPAALQTDVTFNEPELHPGRRIVRVRVLESVHRRDAKRNACVLRSRNHGGESSRHQPEAWTEATRASRLAVIGHRR